MKRLCCFILFFTLLSACGGLYLDDDTKRRNDDRKGEVDLPKDLAEKQSLADILKNCKPDLSVPDNTIDILTDMLNISKYYPPRKIRECLKKKLEDGHNRICDAREELERRRERTHDEVAKTRVENSIYKLEQIQFTFNQNLHNLAVDVDRALIKQEKNHRDYNEWGRFWNWVGQQETESTRNILDIESYSECNIRSRDKK